MSPVPRRVAAHVMEVYLGLTETFVHDALCGLSRYRSLVVAQRLEEPDRFPLPEGAKLVMAAPRRGSAAWFADAVRRRVRGGAPYLERSLAREGAAVVHAHFGPAACGVMETARRARLPLVASFYGYDASIREVVAEYGPRYRRLFEIAAVILVEGPAMGDRLAALGCPREKLLLHRIGIVPARYRFSGRTDDGGPVTVLQCGRMVPKKGLDTALRAFALARRVQPRLALRVLGDGPERPAIERLIDELGIREAVTLLGACPRGVFVRELAAARIFLAPSRTAPDGDSEGGAPTTILEAQASGLPVIATRHADIPFVVDEGASALLAPEGDAEALAEHLVRVATEAGRWPAMGRAGRRFVEQHHDATALAGRLEDLYDELL